MICLFCKVIWYKLSVVDNILNPEMKDIYEKCPVVIQKHPKCLSTLASYYEKYNSEKAAGDRVIVMAIL